MARMGAAGLGVAMMGTAGLGMARENTERARA
jgi:hypothetical protein